ncbi:hypothetical protein [Methylobacterium sp. V23]|uniref:hypothetical protein n=1 Tax=Methylobacterium sp. V23 TaxID=2044878 RepID=UPI000CDB0E45|nr:hypothetical protein [Methylobacterium sp. V23]POR42568.1 hypothetical protein CRT23_12320 [Methylobacterium sp. V23]
MDENADTLPTWGYQPDGAARIFDLAPGEALPEGWFASPDCITDPTLATAEAITARAAGRAYETVLVVSDAATANPLAELEILVTENERLNGIITMGSAENQRLIAEIETVEDARDAALAEVETARGAHAETLTALDHATTALTDLQAQLTKAQADGGFAVEERDAANADLETLRTELAQVRADLDAATAPKASGKAK